jgi:hypothetical protein
MSVAELAASPLEAVREWVNGNGELRGTRQAPGPLVLGATNSELDPPRSPASGAYCVLTRGSIGPEAAPIAEDDVVAWARVVCLVCGTKAALADKAATALVAAFRRAAPPPCAMGDMSCLATANISRPASVPAPGVDQFDYCQQFTADFLLTVL